MKCVYTALVGDYESLIEQPKALESDIEFICLTDNPNLKSKTWTVKLIKPVLPLDMVRSQRHLKILGHPLLSNYQQTLYIDNAMLLTEIPELIFQHFSKSPSLVIPLHSFRETVRAEFEVVARFLLDDPARIAEQKAHYLKLFPHVLDQRPYTGGILLRDHTDEKLRETMEIWHAQVMRYSRRDQLSINAAIDMTGIEVLGYELQNHVSWFHTWVLENNRSAKKRDWHEPGWSPKHAIRRTSNKLRDRVFLVRQKIRKSLRLLRKK